MSVERDRDYRDWGRGTLGSLDDTEQTYPNFERELVAWLQQWPASSLLKESKISLPTKKNSEWREITTADIVGFLHHWYPRPEKHGEPDKAREDYKQAWKALKIKGEQRGQGYDRFYTVAEAEQLLRYVYRNGSRIREKEQK